MLFRIAVFIALLFVTRSGYSQDWIYVGSSIKDDQYYVRSSSTDEYGNKKVWTKRVSKNLTYKKDGKLYTLINGYCLELKEYNCTDRQTKLLSVAFYNSKGSAVLTHKVQEYLAEWDDVVPESVGEMLLDKVCELF